MGMPIVLKFLTFSNVMEHSLNITFSITHSIRHVTLLTKLWNYCQVGRVGRLLLCRFVAPEDVRRKLSNRSDGVVWCVLSVGGGSVLGQNRSRHLLVQPEYSRTCTQMYTQQRAQDTHTAYRHVCAHWHIEHCRPHTPLICTWPCCIFKMNSISIPNQLFPVKQVSEQTS